METSWIYGLLLGIGLSSAVGFRIFVPALLTSIAAYFDQITLAAEMQWMGSMPAIIVFGVATIAEILAYYIPFVDNALDTLAAPLAVICGSLLVGSTIVEMEPYVKWPIAIIAGGGTAGIIQGGTSLVRLKSTSLTAGTANPVVSSVEGIFSGVISVVSIVFPIIGALIVVLLFYWVFKKRFKKKAQE
ncbi:MAG: DUF4126 domain-containing protein [Bacteroidia bacterium]